MNRGENEDLSENTVADGEIRWNDIIVVVRRECSAQSRDRQGAVNCPSGASENSPAIHRWVGSVDDVRESRTNFGPKRESSVVIPPDQDWCGTAEVMSSNVSAVQRLSRPPRRTEFCCRPRNPAMNRWAILIRSLRDRMRMDSCPWCLRFHFNANMGEHTRPCHTPRAPPRRARQQRHTPSPNSPTRSSRLR